MCRTSFNFCSCTHDNATATCKICLAYATHTIYISSCWKIGSFHIVHQLLYLDIVVLDVCDASINNLWKVVRRHIGCHTYSNTRCTVYQKVWNTGRHNGRLLQRIVEVALHINGFFVEVLHHIFTNLAQATLGVTHSCCAIAVYRTIVTLAIYHHVTHCPRLCHTN